jgi:hypothetical protein
MFAFQTCYSLHFKFKELSDEEKLIRGIKTLRLDVSDTLQCNLWSEDGFLDASFKQQVNSYYYENLERVDVIKGFMALSSPLYKELKKRNDIMREIYKTEKNYLDVLTILVEV